MGDPLDYDTNKGGVWAVLCFGAKAALCWSMWILCVTQTMEGTTYLNHCVSPRTRRVGADSSSCVIGYTEE